MLRSVLLALAFFALTAAGCSSSRAIEDEASSEAPRIETPPNPQPTIPRAPSDGSVRVELGKTVQQDGQDITFVQIVQDSRCPADVTCVWQGRVTVTIAVNGQSVQLSAPNGQADPEYPSRAKVNELELSLLAVHPYPGSAEARAGVPVSVDVHLNSVSR